VATKEAILYTHYVTTLALLDMGLSYTEIKNLSNTETVMLTAVQASLNEYRNEQMERNAKHQEAANAHPKFPRRY